MASAYAGSVVRLSVVSLVALAAAPQAGAQDPLKALPDSYKLELENEHVKVVRVRYAPHAKLAAHDHPQGPTAYVYLNDAGPVVFKHIGLEYGEVERPATVKGAVRLGRAVQEVHEVENPNDTASEFLRVEFKQLPAQAREIRGRFFPEAHPAGENLSKVAYENPGLRMTRHACAPAKACDLGARAGAPLVLVAVDGGRIAAAGRSAAVAAGQSEWLAAGAKHVVENREDRVLEFLTFEFKPVAAPASAGAVAR